VSDLDDLTRDLNAAADKTYEETRKVLSKGALNIKTDWREKARTYQKAPRLFRSITYTLDGLTAEIGPVIGHSGSLGGIYEYGTVNNAPQPAGAPALKAETPRFEKALGDMAEGLLGGR
jgi:HK97 gp10 family phage protein